MKLLSAGEASDFVLWTSLRFAFSQTTILKRKNAIDEYLKILQSISDFQLEFAMQRIFLMKAGLSGEDWVLSERLSSDIYQEMLERDLVEEQDFEAKSKNKKRLAEVIDLHERRKSLLDT